MQTRLSSYRLVRFLQLVIAAIAFVGLATLNAGVLVNGVFALAVTFLPGVLKRDYHLSLSPTLTLWITVAVFLHVLGMLGLYEEFWWWDHLTHLFSATLIAGIGYATARAFDEYSDAVSFPPRFMFVYIFLFTLAAGVVWEVFEFTARMGARSVGVQPVLIQYGLSDTIIDLIFDAAGAALVALFGTSVLAGTVEMLLARLSSRE